MSTLDEAIRQVALDYLKPPFKFNCGYVFDAEGHMVADDGDWKNHVVRIRGWGAISYLESPEQLQDMIGTLVAEALTEFWQRDTYRAQRDECLAALRGVVRVADRATVEFDAARAAIAGCENANPPL